MKRKIKMMLAIIIVAILVSCAPNKQQIEQTVLTGFQQKLDTDSQYKAYGLKISSVVIVFSGGNNYEGLAKIQYKKKEYDVPITVTVEGSNVLFQTKPFAFTFLLQ